MKLFHGSIRKKLIILVILATTPVFLMLLGTELINRQNAVAETKKDISIFLNGVAEIQRRITDSTRTLLRTLTSMPEIRDANVETSRLLLVSLLKTNPIYTNATLVNMDGDVVASGTDDKAMGTNFANQKQFREAILGKGFTAGEFISGRSPKAVFPFCMAVIDERGTTRGAIIIEVDLSHYQQLFERGAHLKNTFFGLCDHRGTRLFRYPVSDNTTIGKPINSKIFKAARSSVKPGSIIARTSDGLKHIIAFESLYLQEKQFPYMYMFMGFNYDQVLKPANAILIRGATTSLLSLTLALVITWYIGGRGIARRIEKLTCMTRNFGQGKTNIASGLDYSDGEVGDLARSFDNMVIMLHQRENERNMALEQLGTSEQRFREIIEDVSSISVQGYDKNRKVIFWNQASEEMYGYTKKEALGNKLEDLIIPSQMKEEVKRLHTQWIKEGIKIPSGELVLTDKNGNAVPVFSSHVMQESQFDKEMFCIDIDLRPIKNADSEKELLLNQLRQSQKMEAIGTLAGGIAHDFNNVLFPILGHAEILLERTNGESIETRNSLNQIYSSAIRAKELVQQILTFSRQENTDCNPIKVQGILEEVIKLISSTIPRNIEIKLSVDPDCKAVNANATQIHQVIMNLATNAYHAMGDTGGIMTICLNEIDIQEMLSKNHTIKLGKVICLSVADTGTGMEPELIKKIFDPFFTTKEEGKGTGMGLSVVHGIIKNLKGHIHVNSEPGSGTEFKVYFPVSKNLSLDNSKNKLEEPALVKGTERILLVDDDEAILKMEKQVLERLGYKVEFKTSPIEALELFCQHPNEFDMVITDMSMPGMSGAELASKILRTHPGIPIIICTGFSEKIKPETMKKMGIRDIVMKPVSLRELSLKIKNILNTTMDSN